jgi:hypothetical protein
MLGNQDSRIRSCIWAHRSNEYIQIPIDNTRSRRRQGNRDVNLEVATKMARHDIHHAIKSQKKQHWTKFLDDEKNIWKATRYLNPAAGSSFGRIAAIKGQGGELTQDKPSMAKELPASFFPPPPEPISQDPRRHYGSKVAV